MVINDKVNQLADLMHDLVFFLLTESIRSKSHYEELRKLVDRAEDLWLEEIDEPDYGPAVLHFTTVTEEWETTMEVEENGSKEE